MHPGTESPVTTRTLIRNATRIYASGDRSRAATIARLVIERQPHNVTALFLLGACALDDDKPDEALPFLEAAAKRDPENPNIQRALGMAQLALRHWEHAAQSLQRALLKRPNDSGMLNAAGIALSELGDLDRALHAYREAAQLDPDNADIRNNMAIALDQLRDGNAAINACRESLRINPADAAVWSNMAALLEQTNRVDEAEAAVKAGLARDPQHAGLALTAAICAWRHGDTDGAIASLERLLLRTISTRTRRTAEFKLGHMYDELGKTEVAFDHFQTANELTPQVMPECADTARRFRTELDRLLEVFSASWLDGWVHRSQSVQSEGNPRVAFLVGFPRSGTTLLDTFLGSHPQVTVLEEEPCLEKVLHHLRQLRPPYPEALDQQDLQGWSSLRAIYWRAVSEHTPWHKPDGLLVDKNPYMSAHAGFIHTLIPQARFLFALRHPCDVVLSCFMQSFTGTPIAGSFLTLEDAAETYICVMDLWLRYREICDLKVCELRYESLVEDPTGTLRKVFEFLDLDWQPALDDHTSHARERGRIYTPSYAQVAQPINAKAIARWERYADRFGPALERLRPYVEHFGYAV